MNAAAFLSYFQQACHERLCQGDVIDGVLLGPDARRGLADYTSGLCMTKEVKPTWFPPYEMGFFMGHRIGSMEPDGIAVIKARPKLVDIYFPQKHP
jgi:hypothetical protein